MYIKFNVFHWKRNPNFKYREPHSAFIVWVVLATSVWLSVSALDRRTGASDSPAIVVSSSYRCAPTWSDLTVRTDWPTLGFLWRQAQPCFSARVGCIRLISAIYLETLLDISVLLNSFCLSRDCHGLLASEGVFAAIASFASPFDSWAVHRTCNLSPYESNYWCRGDSPCHSLSLSKGSWRNYWPGEKSSSTGFDCTAGSGSKPSPIRLFCCLEDGSYCLLSCCRITGWRLTLYCSVKFTSSSVISCRFYRLLHSKSSDAVLVSGLQGFLTSCAF